MTTSNREFLDNFSAPYARALTALKLLEIPVPDNINQIRKMLDEGNYQIHIQENVRQYIASALWDVLFKALEDLGALLHVLHRNNQYTIDYVNATAQGVSEVGRVYEHVRNEGQNFNGDKLRQYIHLDTAKDIASKSGQSEADITAIQDLIAQNIQRFAELWFFASDDNLSGILETNWDEHATYIVAHIGDEAGLGSRERNDLTRTNKVAYNKIKHRFFILTESMAKALDNEGATNLRRIKLFNSNDHVEDLLKTVVDITWTEDLIGSFSLHSQP